MKRLLLQIIYWPAYSQTYLPAHLSTYLLVCLFACLLTSCTPAPQQHKHTVFAFGTLIEITLSNTSTPLAEEAFLQLEQDFQRYHDNWTPWYDSDLSTTNHAIKSAKKFTLPPTIKPLIIQSQKHFVNSEGLFNPAIGELIKLWRFHEHDKSDIKPPDANEIKQAVERNPKITDINITGDTATSANTAVDLNFGAFAKGYGLALAMQTLQQMHIENAVINAGGDLLVNGNAGKRAWNIGIRHPREAGVIASIQAQSGEAVFTSGDYERSYIYSDKRYHHILDPRTGYPAEGAMSVTVIHDDAGTADAAATALLIAGKDHWHRIARKMALRYVMLIDQDSRIYMTPAMAQRVKFEIQAQPHIVLAEPL